jgi:hypothetical protein
MMSFQMKRRDRRGQTATCGRAIYRIFVLRTTVRSGPLLKNGRQSKPIVRHRTDGVRLLPNIAESMLAFDAAHVAPDESQSSIATMLCALKNRPLSWFSIVFQLKDLRAIALDRYEFG